MGERLLAAFSLRSNLRALFVPSEGRLRPLVGIRALSILWVMLFHSAWYSFERVPDDTYVALLSARWMLPLWRGSFGVDVFFALSGFLIAGMLLDERAATGRARVGLFYLRRFLRLWPALAATVAIDVLFVRRGSGMAWADLVYATNFVPVSEACVGWAWSLAIEEQFYLVCPWLLRAVEEEPAGTQIAIVAALIALLCVVAGFVVADGDFYAFDVEIVINRDIMRWNAAFDALYDKPWMRFGPLLAGVGAAIVYRMPGAMACIAHAPKRSLAALIGALVVAAACTHWPLVAGAPRPLEIAYLAGFRALFGLSAASIIVLSLAENRVGRALGAALSVRVLHPVAELAYSAYLLNPIVTGNVHAALAPAVAHGEHPMLVFAPLDILATFGAATVLYLFVERPFMALRPRAGGAVGAHAAAVP